MTVPIKLQNRLRYAIGRALADIDGILIGVDVVDTRRFEHLTHIGGDRFIERQFTPAEVDTCDRDPSRLAARFAGKEATAKVLRTGFRGGLAARHIEICSAPDGVPYVVLHGPAAERADRMNIAVLDISLTHENALAAAIAVGRQYR